METAKSLKRTVSIPLPRPTSGKRPSFSHPSELVSLTDGDLMSFDEPPQAFDGAQGASGAGDDIFGALAILEPEPSMQFARGA